MLAFYHNLFYLLVMSETEMIPKDWMWLVELAVGVAIVIALSLLLKRIAIYFKSAKQSHEKLWKRQLHKIAHLPLQLAVWGFGVAYIVDVIATEFGLEEVAKYARPLKGAFIIACIGWIVLRWIREGFSHLAKKSEKLGVSTNTIAALNKLSTVVVSILVLIFIFQIFGLNVGPLLTFGGVGVAGVAFAAKDMVSNFFGGAMLHITRIFTIGDEIVIPSKDDFQGIVKEIGWYTTMVLDYYKRPVYFPNALFSTVHVINESRRTHRRIKETISLRYEDLPKVETIIKGMEEKLSAHVDVDEMESFSITLFHYGPVGIDIYLYFLVHRMPLIKFLKTKQELFLIIKEVVEENGAEFAFPTTNVNLFQKSI